MLFPPLGGRGGRRGAHTHTHTPGCANGVPLRLGYLDLMHENACCCNAAAALELLAACIDAPAKIRGLQRPPHAVRRARRAARLVAAVGAARPAVVNPPLTDRR